MIVWPTITAFAETIQIRAIRVMRDVACSRQAGGVPIIPNGPELDCVLEFPCHVGGSPASLVTILGCRAIQPRQMQDVDILCVVLIS